MEILVNRNKVNIDINEIQTLQELVKTIEDKILGQSGHVITQIEVNQISLSDEQELNTLIFQSVKLNNYQYAPVLHTNLCSVDLKIACKCYPK